jgi:hypothetical protein
VTVSLGNCPPPTRSSGAGCSASCAGAGTGSLNASSRGSSANGASMDHRTDLTASIRSASEWYEFLTNTYLDQRHRNWALSEEMGDVIFVGRAASCSFTVTGPNTSRGRSAGAPRLRYESRRSRCRR